MLHWAANFFILLTWSCQRTMRPVGELSEVNTIAADISNSASLNCVPPTTRSIGNAFTSPGDTSQGVVPVGPCGTVTVSQWVADWPGTNWAPLPSHNGSTSRPRSPQRITAALTSGTDVSIH